MNLIPPSYDEQAWNQMLRYLDGTLPDADVAELNARLKDDPQFRDLFGELLLQQVKLRQIAEEEQVVREATEESALIESAENIIPLPRRELLTDRVMRQADRVTAGRRRAERIRGHFRRFRLSAGLAMAACLALIGLALWIFLMPAKLATLAMADPGVVIERGKFELMAEAGMTIRAGDRVVTPDTGRAMFAYNNEPTEVTVHSGTRLGVDIVRESKQLTLDRGAFVADVAKQDPNHPLGLVTPQAEAIVVGTRFMLSTAGTSTKLEVFEGAVRIMQSQEGPSMQVPAGHFVNVEPGRPVSLLPLPKSTGGVQLEHWRGSGQGGTNELTLNELMFSGVGVAPGGSRVRGYLHPPLSGAYLFQLNANSKVEMRLSDSANPAATKSIVATEYGSAETMSSKVILMQAGQRYYFELDCESETLPANFTVSWKMPGGMHRVVYGEYLSPFDGGNPSR